MALQQHGFMSDLSIALNGSDLPGGASAGFTTAVLEHWGYESLRDLSAQPLTNTHRHHSVLLRKQQNSVSAHLPRHVRPLILLLAKLQRQPKLTEALHLHRTWQGGKGSGLDVASCWHGGVIRFQNAQVENYPGQTNLKWQIVWSGISAATTDHIANFDQWYKNGDIEPAQAVQRPLRNALQ